MPGFRIDGSGSPADPNIGGGDLLRVHRWRIDRLLDKDFSTPPFVYAKTVDLPDKTYEVEEIKTMGGSYKFAKQTRYGDLKVNFYGTNKLADELENLAEQVHTEADGLKDFNDYMGTINLTFYDGSGEENENSVQYTFNNCFIINVSYDQLTYMTSDIFSITATFAVGFYTVSASG